MKKALILAGAVLLTGAMAVAATVTGNNVVTVIEKDAVVSKNNYQFLCLPVKAIDITGKKSLDDDATTLGKLFPASAELNEVQVTLGGKTYKVQGGAWIDTATGVAPVADPGLKAGQIFWVQNYPEGRKPLFVGEVTGLGVKVLGDGPLLEAGNAGETALSITETFTPDKYTLVPGQSFLYCLKSRSNNYRVFRYESVGNGKNGWTETRPNQWRREPIDSTVVIQPGEAFYLQNVSVPKAP